MPSGPNQKKNLPVYISAEKIQQRVKALAKKINHTYGDEELVVIGILTGSFIFMADLIRQLKMPLYCDTMQIASYGDAKESSGIVKIRKLPAYKLKKRHVLIVEDIVDTGLTLETIISNLKKEAPLSVRVASLLYKPERDLKHPQIDFLGFEIENLFVVGYGLDCGGKYRNLPYISYMEE